MHYVHKKVKGGPEIATITTKTLNFSRAICLNWWTKIELRGEPLTVNIVANYCCKRKMLKETETGQTIGFFATFLSLVTLQLV